MKDLITPTLGSGFRDYLPKEMIPRQKMLDTIRRVFELYGFVPLDTPGIEKEEILTGGDENFKMHIFRTGLQRSDDEFALRFDLTIPLARVVAMYSDLPRPFKRYQIGKVWRGERPQAGRYREFTQCDADSVGVASPLADAEIISLMHEVMTALGFSRFLIRVNNRKILTGLAEYVGFPAENITHVLRSLDKLDKIAWEGVSKELQEKSGFNAEQLERMKKFIDIRAADQQGTINAVRALMHNSAIANEGLDELTVISKHLDAFGVSRERWTIDLSIARGLGYYTGPVFETILQDLPSIGSVFSGGRYDGLVSRFSTQSVPATGASVGIDRLFAAMEKLKLIESSASTARVMVLNFDASAEQACATAAANLRKNGIPTELYLGKENMLKGQLTHALRQDIPVVVIIGEDELKKGVAQVKHLPTRKQMEVPLDQIPEEISTLLA